MLRKDINAHLPHCPASVIMCTAEWNRWPLFTWKRRKNIPFKQVNPLGVSDQLDIALTLRDQRMLDSLKCIKSRKTRLSLRNNLTRRYPAVPLPRLELKGHDKDFRLELGLMDPFSGTEVDKDPQAEAQLKQWEEDFDCRLKTKNYQKIPKYWEFPELEKGNIHKHCSSCFDLKCLKKESKEGACNIIQCRWKCGASFHSCKSSEHKLICPKYEDEDEFGWMMRGVTNLDIRMKKKSGVVIAQLKPLDDLFKGGPGEPAFKKIQKILPGGGKIPIPPTPPDNLLKSQTGLDVTIETVTRLQTKPNQMYTFVCGQEFRRDEYAWHCKVIHDQVIGGLNNWVEHRCPLSSLGCGFSHRRLFPGGHASSVESENTLIFSPAVESFGITNNATAAAKKTTFQRVSPSDSCNSKSLLDLPLELLLDIVASLDSFSISNLAVVSVYLRQVCCILLDTRGLVTLQWQRRCNVDKPNFKTTTQWQVSHKRWFFSTSVGRVESWRFSKNADGAVSEHLKECPYNVKTKHVDAKKLDKNWPVVMQGLQEKLSKRLQLR